MCIEQDTVSDEEVSDYTDTPHTEWREVREAVGEKRHGELHNIGQFTPKYNRTTTELLPHV